MKKIIIVSILGFIFLLLQAQEVKLNQTEPLNKKAGREVKLKKVMTITDEQGGFYFRMPEGLRISDDDSIYIMDSDQLLRFGKKGKLLNNYYKSGQGPGELTIMRNFILVGNSVVIFNRSPSKVVWFDKNGSYLKEIKILQPIIFPNLILFHKEKYFFYSSGITEIKGKPRIVDVEYYISEISPDGNVYKKLFSFPVQEYIDAGKGWYSYSIGKFEAEVFKNRYLIISHTPEYLIKIYDTEENRIIFTFSRKYRRVKSNPDEKRSKKAPKLEYEKDIESIFASSDIIWVTTSTKEPQKGTLVDIFDHRGNYLDNFYIKLKGDILGYRKNHIYVKETAKDLNVKIVKYRLGENM